MEFPKSLIEAIKQALQDEAVGKAIYIKAAKDANYKDVEEFFLQMAKEEEEHIKYLNKLYQHVDKKSTHSEVLSDIRHNFKPSKEIFDKKFLSEISKNESLLLSLNKSANLEKNSMSFYKKCANLAKDDATKEFFKSMVVWENDHLNRILNIFESIDDNEISFKQDELDL